MIQRAMRWLAKFGVEPRDLRLPVLLALVSQADVWLPWPLNLGHVVGPAPLVSALYVSTSLMLIWRRSAPVAVLALVVAANAVDYLAFGAPEGLGTLLPPVAAFYGVGRWARPGALAIAAPLMLLGTAVHELTDPEFSFSGANAVFYALVAGAWPLGRAFEHSAREREEAEARARAGARAREASAREATTAERARIARELHDVVGHGLSVVVLQLVGAAALLEAGATAQGTERLAVAESSARGALDEMRRLLELLGPETDDNATLPQPGLHDLPRLIEETRAAGARVAFSVDGRAEELPAGLDLAAYRIVQESLTNVLKHARPPDCSVRIGYTGTAVELDIVDDGTAPAPPGPHSGRGLTGMRERVALYDGVADIGPRDNHGFGVSVRLPITEAS